jgi:cardiolipin synthase
MLPEDWIKWIAHAWHYVVLAVTVLLALIASGHALLYRRDARAATLWVSFIWLMPLVGAVLYFIFGINRIKRRAVLLRGHLEPCRVEPSAPLCTVEQLALQLPPECAHLTSLARAAETVLTRPLLPGNRVEMLENGDAAFPAMLEAIRDAKQSITLSTYIFDHDEAGL